jgi:predicted nuclease of predicted toxin-antitoxin system
MHIFIDENIPKITAIELDSKGHHVIDIRGTNLEGSDDNQVWEMAQTNGCLLITTDKGFNKHRFESHHGILIICLRQPNQFKIHQRIISALENTDENYWLGQLIIIRDNTISRWQYQQN